MATATAGWAAAEAEGPYPVQLVPPPGRELNHWWGIPLLGMVARAFLLIPHVVVMWALAIGVGVIMFVGWIPILLYGRVPAMQQAIVKEAIHRAARMNSYVFLLPGDYPPLEPGAPGPIDVRFATEGRTIDRRWGIPVLGAFARLIALFPHLIVMGILQAVSALTLLIVWVPILLYGRYPEPAMQIVTGWLRYYSRVAAYALMLPVPYPPFSLE